MRISVSDLDQLRYYKDSEMELSDLLARLRRETPPTREMQAGTALHKFLDLSENGGDIEQIDVDGFRFRFELDGEIALPQIRELKALKEYDINGQAVTLVGKVDALNGLTVYDHKLSASFDAERYTDALQWRAYLVIFGAKQFTYNVFVGGEEAKTGEWKIREFHQVSFYTYPGIERDILKAVTEYVQFANQHLVQAVSVSPAA
jgi:hypothetical protein